jgi:hypothetical protein
MDTTEKRFTLDGEPIEDFGTFLRENADDFTVEDAQRFDALQPGEEVLLGGGAAATFVLRREA